MHICNVQMKLPASSGSGHTCFGHTFVVSFTVLSRQSYFFHAFIASLTVLSLGLEDQPDCCEVVATMLTSQSTLLEKVPDLCHKFLTTVFTLVYV
jgi:hypothetical protein